MTVRHTLYGWCVCDGRTGGPRQESPSGSGAPSVVVADTSPQVASSATLAGRTERLSTGSLLGQ